MEQEVGSIVQGRVTGITKFGAFVSFGENKTGMVHISEVAHSYVSNIGEHLSEGQEVTVKIIGVSPEGRINLSIKKALPHPAPVRSDFAHAGARRVSASATLSPPSFEDKLKAFMSDSESKMSDLRHHSDKRSSRKRR